MFTLPTRQQQLPRSLKFSKRKTQRSSAHFLHCSFVRRFSRWVIARLLMRGPPRIRSFPQVPGGHCWECPEVITPAHSSGGGWVAHHFTTLVYSHDIEVQVAALTLASVAKNNHGVAVTLLELPREGQLRVCVPHDLTFSGLLTSVTISDDSPITLTPALNFAKFVFLIWRHTTDHGKLKKPGFFKRPFDVLTTQQREAYLVCAGRTCHHLDPGGVHTMSSGEMRLTTSDYCSRWHQRSPTGNVVRYAAFQCVPTFSSRLCVNRLSIQA